MKSIRKSIWICALCLMCFPMSVSAQLYDEWRAFPGTAPMAEQMEVLSWLKEMKSEKNTDKYIFSEAVSDLCFSLGEAEEQAKAMGRLGLISALDNEYQSTTHVDEATKTTTETTGFKYGNFEHTLTTVETDNFELISSRYVLKYKDVTLYETIDEGQKDIIIKTYWDAVVRYSDSDPLLRTAWCVLKLYRRQSSRYQVKVVMCNYY